jgi:pyruvate dehydrogenase E1 component beta subunit
MSTRELTIREAIREGIREEMATDERIFLMGENVAGAGGIFKLTEGCCLNLARRG